MAVPCLIDVRALSGFRCGLIFPCESPPLHQNRLFVVLLFVYQSISCIFYSEVHKHFFIFESDLRENNFLSVSRNRFLSTQ